MRPIRIHYLSFIMISLLIASCSVPATTTPAPRAATTPLQSQALPASATTNDTSVAESATPTTTAAAATTVATAAPTLTLAPVNPTAPTTAELQPPPTEPLWSYPVGIAGRPLGDGFVIRHIYAAENTWFNPGWWHTGEDWYRAEGDSTGARVYAAADGDVVFVGGNYPGRVVILQHASELFSMYGHLDPQLAVKKGQRVSRGDWLGTIGPGTERAPAHLHFEIRTFLTHRAVNGSAPRYRYRCGVDCAPGPGYWPINAPEHPSVLGWRDPTALINYHAFSSPTLPTREPPLAEVVVATQPVSPSATLWSSSPTSSAQPQAIGQVQLTPGERFLLMGIETDSAETKRRSAQDVKLWYNVRAVDGRQGWVQAAVPVKLETGADGRPSSVAFNFFPAVIAP